MALTKIKTGSVSDSITLTSPDINTPDIDGGTIDGTVIGGATPAAASVTSLSVDTITIDGSEIDASGSLTLDVAGDITLDADGGSVFFKDAGTEFFKVRNTGSDVQIYSARSDADIKIEGVDGGVGITALTLDMSAAGAATFNAGATFGGNSTFLAPNINITADDARLVVQEADGTNMVWLGDLTGAGVGGLFLYNHGGTAVVQLRSDSASLIGHGLTVDGNVGIGMTPAKLLDLQATDNLAMRFYNSTSFKAGIEVPTSSGDMITGSAVNDLAIRSQGNMLFAAGGATERMRIDSSGALLVGCTAFPSASVKGLAIRPNGTAGQYIQFGVSLTTGVTVQQFQNPNGVIGQIKLIGSATQYLTSSDYRLKENVVAMTGSIDRVKALKPSRFNFIADADNTVDGFLAHEAQAVVPESVTGTKDAMRDEEYEVTAAIEEVRDEDDNITTEAVEAVMGTRSVPDMQGIDQAKLVPLLVSALQEAVSKIEELTARITALEGE